MSHSIPIGEKIKVLRTSRNLTLKQLGEMTGLSTGFLSQMERGMSSIAIDTLEKIADVLCVSLSSFFEPETDMVYDPVIHSFSHTAVPVSPEIIQTVLTNDLTGFAMLPRLFDLLPMAASDAKELQMYSHNGEEFIYVLEGIVTMQVQNHQYTLYPGDCIQIHSNESHNWMNCTNKTAKLLSVNTPNPFKHPEDGHIMP